LCPSEQLSCLARSVISLSGFGRKIRTDDAPVPNPPEASRRFTPDDPGQDSRYLPHVFPRPFKRNLGNNAHSLLVHIVPCVFSACWFLMAPLVSQASFHCPPVPQQDPQIVQPSPYDFHRPRPKIALTRRRTEKKYLRCLSIVPLWPVPNVFSVHAIFWLRVGPNPWSTVKTPVPLFGALMVPGGDRPGLVAFKWEFLRRNWSGSVQVEAERASPVNEECQGRARPPDLPCRLSMTVASTKSLHPRRPANFFPPTLRLPRGGVRP